MKIHTTLDRKTNKLRLFTFALAVWLLIAALPISAFAELLELETQPMGGSDRVRACRGYDQAQRV